MSDKVAKKDITVRDRLGRTVVVVPAGQPIPDNVDELKQRYGAVAAPDAKAQDAPAENKAKRSSSRKSR